MKSILSLVYPIHNITQLELNNIVFTNNSLRRHVEIICVIDNPLISKKIIKIFNEYNINYYINDKNIGKYQTIKNAADNGYIKTKWFKVCDPDDIILIKKIKKFKEKRKFKNANIIRFFPSILIKPGEWNSEEINKGMHSEKIWTRKISSVVNENTVHLTKDLIDFDLKAHNQTKSSDVLLALSGFTSRKAKIVNYKKSFYLYNYHNGIISGNKSFNKDMVEQLISFLKIMEKYNDINKMKAPSFFDFKWAFNKITNSDLEFSEKEKYVKQIFYLLKIVSRDNINWKSKWDDKTYNKYIEILKKGEEII